MKYIFKEEQADYDNYKFPYQVHAQLEPQDNIDEIMAEGFLPTRMAKNLFYKTRSVRINLKDFELNSENRRIANKTDYLQIEESTVKEFGDTQKELIEMARDYYDKKFGKQIISADTFKKILNGEMYTHILVFNDILTKRHVGFTIIYRTDKSAYYAYPIYNMSYFERNIGIGMMLKAIEFYKALNFDWFYIGTAYTQASKYKLQFNSLQWHSGNTWQTNIEALKTKLKQ